MEELLSQSQCRVHAYRDASRSASRELEEERMNMLEQAAHRAQLGGQLAEAVRAWREVLSSPLLSDDMMSRATASHSLATAYALQGADVHNNYYLAFPKEQLDGETKVADRRVA